MPNDPEGRAFQGIRGRQQLARLLAGLFPDAAQAIVRRVDDARFVAFSPGDAGQLVTDWTEGQVFGESAEVRWRRQGDSYAVLLLTESGQAADGLQPLPGSPFTVVRPSGAADHGLLLWGTRRKDDAWWEARIPRPLEYPIQHRDREGADRLPPPRLDYRLYQDGGAVRWVRLVGLVEERRP